MGGREKTFWAALNLKGMSGGGSTPGKTQEGAEVSEKVARAPESVLHGRAKRLFPCRVTEDSQTHHPPPLEKIGKA